MKKILLATDFSQGSLTALQFATEVAHRAEADLSMIWVNSARHKEVLLNVSEEALDNEARKRMEELCYKTKAALPSTNVSCCIRYGKVYQEVANQAKYDDSDIIVCSTHGVSGFESKWIGSNAHRIVANSVKPVITLRPDFDLQQTHPVLVLPIDSSHDTRQKVTIACQMAKILGCEIHILGLYSTSLSSIKRKVDQHVAQVEKYLTGEGITCLLKFEEVSNLTQYCIEYSESVNARMIAIMTGEVAVISQRLTARSSMPVINVPPKSTTVY